MFLVKKMWYDISYFVALSLPMIVWNRTIMVHICVLAAIHGCW